MRPGPLAPRVRSAQIVFCAVFVACSGLAFARIAWAQTPPSPAPSSPPPEAPATDPALEEAKELFRKGNELMKAGDCERALDFFQRSRGLVASVPNTLNAAICLDRLERADEALELYEQILTQFAGKVDDQTKLLIANAMGTLRKRVGSLDVSANVDGELVIDGRKRGKLPLTGPVRVLPGQHTVRVMKDGYAPGEQKITVALGELKGIDLKLEPLAATGRLAVKGPANGAGIDVLVDGAPVGTLPWEGLLAPGPHFVSLRGAALGTAPRRVMVVVGQTTTVELEPVVVGKVVRIEVEPRTALVSLDDVDLGSGTWAGKLPIGAHRVRVTETGYFTEARAIDGAKGGLVRIKLRVDEDHPRWGRGPRARFRVELHGGLGLAGSLGSVAEDSCDDVSCADNGSALGFVAGLRGVYSFPFGLRIDLGGGYLRFGKSLTRTVPSPENTSDVAITSTEDLALGGFFAGLGVGYTLPIGERLRVGARGAGGLLIASASSTADAHFVRGSDRAPLTVEGSGASRRAIDVLVQPEALAELAFGKVHVGLGVGALVFLLPGPEGLGAVRASDAAECATRPPTDLACATKGSAALKGELYSTFAALSAQLYAGYTF